MDTLCHAPFRVVGFEDGCVVYSRLATYARAEMRQKLEQAEIQDHSQGYFAYENKRSEIRDKI